VFGFCDNLPPLEGKPEFESVGSTDSSAGSDESDGKSETEATSEAKSETRSLVSEAVEDPAVGTSEAPEDKERSLTCLLQ